MLTIDVWILFRPNFWVQLKREACVTRLFFFEQLEKERQKKKSKEKKKQYNEMSNTRDTNYFV